MCNKKLIGTKNYEKPIIVSLTSYSKRLLTVEKTIQSIIRQTYQNIKVILWVSHDDKNLIPASLRKLESEIFNIKFVADIKSYKKLIPALKIYPDHIIITADDDIIYSNNWIEVLLKEHLRYNNDIIAHRCHRIKFDSNGNMLPYKYWQHCVKIYSRSILNFTTCGGACRAF
ncbi:MAG: glycosyltransferase [Clostridiales bacterium]|nr:glycosyltransferase [Clostridiales bacterium]